MFNMDDIFVVIRQHKMFSMSIRQLIEMEERHLNSPYNTQIIAEAARQVADLKCSDQILN